MITGELKKMKHKIKYSRSEIEELTTTYSDIEEITDSYRKIKFFIYNRNLIRSFGSHCNEYRTSR